MGKKGEGEWVELSGQRVSARLTDTRIVMQATPGWISNGSGWVPSQGTVEAYFDLKPSVYGPGRGMGVAYKSERRNHSITSVVGANVKDIDLSDEGTWPPCSPAIRARLEAERAARQEAKEKDLQQWRREVKKRMLLDEVRAAQDALLVAAKGRVDPATLLLLGDSPEAKILQAALAVQVAQAKVEGGEWRNG